MTSMTPSVLADEEALVDGVDVAEGPRAELLDVDRRAAQLLQVEDQLHHLQGGDQAVLEDRQVVPQLPRAQLAAGPADPAPQRFPHVRFAPLLHAHAAFSSAIIP